MDRALRRKLGAMPLRRLRELQHDLKQLVAELEGQPRREIDIAVEHSGDPSLVASVLRTIGDPNGNDWYQVECIYCSAERCARCPHGDFRFQYRRNKRKGTVSKKYVGTMAFSHELIERLKAGVRNPVAAYVFYEKPDSGKAT